MTRINEAPEPKGGKLFTLPDLSSSDTPHAPPPEVLDALDRGARVMAELDRKNVTVSLDTSGTGPPRVVLHHPGTAPAEISPRALVNLLDGETALLPGGRLP